jgi:uncharacterized protein
MTTPPWPAAEPDGPQPVPPGHASPPQEPPQRQAPLRPASPPQGWGPPAGPYEPYGHQPPYGQNGPYTQSGQYSQYGHPGQYGPYGGSYGPPQPYPPFGYYPRPAPAPSREDRPPHRWGFGAFLLAEATFLLTSLLVPIVAMVPYLLRGQASGDRATLPGPVLLAALAVPPLVAAAVGLAATKVRGNGPVVDLRLRFGWRDVGIGVACGVVGLFLIIPVGWLWVYVVGEDNANSAVGQVFDGMHMPLVLAVLVFLDVWLVAPICEEILYRGLLWGAMERRAWNRWIILVVTTVVFALAHFEPVRAPLLLVIGLPIGMARMLSGRLAASIIAHQINNFLPAVGLMLLLLGHPITG